MRLSGIDPSRTTLIRRRFVSETRRRFKKVSQAIRKLVVKDDVLGLVPSSSLVVMQEVQAWRFKTDAGKVQAYRKWLQERIDADVLSTDPVSGRPWTATYVQSSYRKGLSRAYADANKTKLVDLEGTRGEFLREAFGAPETLSKIELLSTRTFEELRGVTAAMSQQMSRTLAEGLAAGRGPKVIARELRKNVVDITRRRANVLARTEVIHAHAEGQLDSFERLGVEEVGLMAELSTAGDERVCERCSDAAADGPYPVKEARGMIPLHPNCRCAWVPLVEKEKKKERASVRMPVRLPGRKPMFVRIPKRVKIPTKTPMSSVVSGTKFSTAEDYRQYLIQQVKAAKTEVGKKLIKDLTKESKELWLKIIKIEDIEVRKSLFLKLKILEKELKAAKKAVKISVETQRKLLDEVSSKIGDFELISGASEKATYQPVIDSMLSWVPKTRRVSSEFGRCGVERFSKSYTDLLGSYFEDKQVIHMFVNSKQVFAHEFGHHLGYQLKGFMRVQNNFFKRRTVGEKVSNIMHGIQGKKNKFKSLDVYAGRIYKDGQTPEVVSIGLEHLWANPYKVATKDPEWFNMIVSQLKGIPTEVGAEL